VDINEESVEIAKLSLWLRTAHRDRKLSNLNSNIKCGNSLIDDPEVAGDKAFDWNKEFPQIFREKKKQAWHITTATHNSRYSQRMFDYHINVGEAIWLNDDDAIVITKAISEIVKDNKEKNEEIYLLAYNICGDHMHMLLVCEEKEVSKIVGKIKGKSSLLYHRSIGSTPTRGRVPLSGGDDASSSVRLDGENSVPLWTQKFGNSRIDSEEYLLNAMDYIRTNRIKHELPENVELENIINGMLTTTEHAFRKEYNGGFDVVIGNPPYVQSHSISEVEKQYIYDKYRTAEYQINTYGIFVEKFLSLLKKDSYYSLIIPNYWLSTKYDKSLRKEVFIKNHALEVINTFEVFEEATVDTLILTGRKNTSKENKTCVNSISKSYKSIEQRLNAINQRNWDYSEIKQFQTDAEDVKINFNHGFNLKGNSTLKDYFSMYQGMKPYEKGKGSPLQTREMMVQKIYHSDSKIDDTYLPLLGAKHIKRHYLMPFDEFIKYGKNLAAPRNLDMFIGERILINRILSRKTIDAVLLSETFINNTDVFNLIPTHNNPIAIKVLYALIVSKLCATYFKKSNVNLNRNAFPKINVNTLETFPIPEISKAKQETIEKLVDSLLMKTSQFQQKKNEFLSRVKDNFSIEKTSNKLEAFYNFDFKTFVAEVEKQKRKVTLTQQVEWEEFFNTYKAEINNLQNEINQTDKAIDQMVYELYGLTEEEIGIVEGGV